jgi:Fur family ferric uptake transcriptional regulator
MVALAFAVAVALAFVLALALAFVLALALAFVLALAVAVAFVLAHVPAPTRMRPQANARLPIGRQSDTFGAMAPRTAPVSLDELRRQIRAAGLRATAPRLAVLRGLIQAATPRSHADLMEQLAPEGWDRATVYRNLTDLTEAALVRRSDLGDHVWRFELRREDGAHAGGQHPHFLCNECGDIVCLPGESVEIKPARGAPHALRKKAVEIQVRGRCDRCA